MGEKGKRIVVGGWSNTSLIKKIEDGYLPEVIGILRELTRYQRRALVNQPDPKGNTMLISCLYMYSLNKRIDDSDEALKLFRYLVLSCDADVNRPCHGCASSYVWIRLPLSLAISEHSNSLAIQLIHFGADIHGDKKHQSVDPIMAACFVKNIQMVKYLMSLGVSVNGLKVGVKFDPRAVDCDLHDMTCLMQSIYHTELCKVLLENGADIEEEDGCGRTALHHPVLKMAYDTTDWEKEVSPTLNLFLSHGAKYKWEDDRRPDILLCIAVYGHDKLMEHFLRRTKHSKEEVINAYELLGAGAFTDKCEILDEDLKKSLKWWNIAMNMRYSNPERPIRKKLPSRSQVMNQDIKEPETFGELYGIMWDQATLQAHQLLIIERVLGYGNSLFVEACVNFSYEMFRTDYKGIPSSDHLSLLQYSLNSIKNDFGKIMDHGRSVTKKLVDGLKERFPVFPKSDALDVVSALTDLISTMLDHSSQTTMTPHQIDLYCYLCLKAVNLCLRIEGDHSDNTVDKVRSDNIITEFGSKCIKRINNHCCQGNKLISWLEKTFYPKKLLKFLLRHGLDMNCRDSDGNSAMLKLTIAFKEKNPYLPEDFDKRDEEFFQESAKFNSKIELMLEHGAHWDLCNNIGETVRDYLPDGYVGPLDSPCQLMTLQCLASNIIVENYLDYTGVIPEHMLKFIDMHQPARSTHRPR